MVWGILAISPDARGGKHSGYDIYSLVAKDSNSSNDGSNIHRARHQGQVTRDDDESQVGGELTRMVVRRIKRPLLTGPRGAVMEWVDSLVSG